jgi:nucleoside-triphosphatase
MKNILITGLPGVGKTGLIKKLFEIFKEFNPAGFYTAEIREDGVRTGFEIVSLYGDTDIKGFEQLIEDIFSRGKKTGLYIIDEIGKMECKSKKFSKLIIELLNSDKPVIASVAEKGTGIINDIKKLDNITLYKITPHNRDQTLKKLTMAIRDTLLE